MSEVASVTAVTERETNKVMDKLDMISQSLDQQRAIITEVMRHESAQNPVVQNAINQIMTAASDIQNKIYEAMDLMQFQDITRQKLERIMLHLRQIHDYIVELLGTGFKSEQQPLVVSVSRTIAQTGTTPDENKDHADSIIEAFRQAKK
jgi:acetyl-CoA carboxylase alpha subunit